MRTVSLKLLPFILLICVIGFLSLVGIHLLWNMFLLLLSWEDLMLLGLKSKPTNTDYFYHETFNSYKARMMKEDEYKKKLKALNETDIETLSSYYHRDIELQWSRSLLPPTVPIYSIQCLPYSMIEYNVKVSIVIPYYNEVMTLLLTTITTIVHRTSPKYLYEIILIDDCSDKDEKDEIREYASKLNIPVKLIRNSEQLGITDSRLYGIGKAGGDVIVILDSHMEVGNMWLEPLLKIIMDRPKSIAVPSMRMMDEHDEDDPWKHTISTTIMQFGYGFLNYGITYDPKDEEKHLPILSPSLMGGSLAAFKSTLLEFYPQGLVSKSWGVENNRISIRVWLCGEGIYTTGCSFVKHTNGKDKNLQRYFKGMNNLWTDLIRESISEILNFIPTWDEKMRLIKRVVRTDVEINQFFQTADIIKSQFTPSQHQCDRDYHWYLDNIQHFFVSRDHLDSLYVGEVQSMLHPTTCLEAHGGVNYVMIYHCRKEALLMDDAHVIQFAKNHAIHTMFGNCFDSGGNDTSGSLLYQYSCHILATKDGENSGTQRFIYDAGSQHIQHVASDRCVDLTGLEVTNAVLLTKCDVTNVGQRWNISTVPWF